MNIEDLRSNDRFTISGPLPGSYGSASINVVNLSANGALIEHGQPIRLGTVARFWFRRSDVAVSVQALTIWSRLSKTKDDKGKLLYMSGLRIETDTDEYLLALQTLIDHGGAKRDAEALERKRRKLQDRADEKAGVPQMKMLKQTDEPSAEQVLLIQHARERLRTHPEEAQKWYNRARYADVAVDGLLYREDALAVWEYLERSVDLATIVRVFEKMRIP